MSLSIEEQRKKARRLSKKELPPIGTERRKRYLQNEAMKLARNRSNELIKKATEAEKLLMREIDFGGVLDYKFQYIIMKGKTFFIADFAFGNLVVEIDGSSHDSAKQRKKDDRRTKTLNKWGYKVIRFTNKQVFGRVKWVIDMIIKDVYK